MPRVANSCAWSRCFGRAKLRWKSHGSPGPSPRGSAARGAPVLERLIADGLAGRFPAEEVNIRDKVQQPIVTNSCNDYS